MAPRLRLSSLAFGVLLGGIAGTILAMPEVAQAFGTPLWQAVDDSKNLKLWTVFRDLVNWAMAGLLIVTAFATILRINVDTYGVKKLLPALLIGFVLANFSLFFSRTIIQASESLQRTPDAIVKLVTDGTGINSIMWGDWVMGIVVGVIGGLLALFTGPFAIIFGVIIFLLTMFLPLIIIAILGLMFWIRHYVVQYLVVLAPLGLFALVLPFTKNLGQKWLNMFLTWVFMRPLAYMLLGFGALVVRSDVAGPIVSFIFGLSMMLAAITIPWKAGGYINATIGKLSGKLAISGVKSGYTNMMKHPAFQKDGRFERVGAGINRLAFGWQANQARKERDLRIATGKGKGQASDFLENERALRRQMRRFRRSGDPAKEQRAAEARDMERTGRLDPVGAKSMFMTEDEQKRQFRRLGIIESFAQRDFADQDEIEKRKKELPLSDKNSVIRGLFNADDPVDKKIYAEAAAEMGKGLADKIKSFLDELKDPTTGGPDGAFAAREYEEKMAMGADEELDWSDDTSVMKAFLALTRSQEEARAMAAAGPAWRAQNAGETDEQYRDFKRDRNQAIIQHAGTRQNNQFSNNVVANISNKFFDNGDFHLGGMVARKIADRIARVVEDSNTRMNGNIAQMYGTLEPQKITTMITGAATKSQFWGEALSKRDAQSIASQIDRLRGEARTNTAQMLERAQADDYRKNLDHARSDLDVDTNRQHWDHSRFIIEIAKALKVEDRPTIQDPTNPAHPGILPPRP